MTSPGWRFFIDRGGTFTDVVAVDPAGQRHVRKVLSSDRGGEDAALGAIRSVAPEGARIDGVRMGTTVATNALLERRGEPFILAITRGFEDLLDIGSQDRPDLFALRIEKPAPLHAKVVAIDERVLADGTVRRSPDEAAVRETLRAARATGRASLAIALVHGAAHPAHERLVARLAREAGFLHVVTSHEVASAPGLLARAETSEADAFLSPVLARHVARLREALGADTELRFMQSSGGLVRGEDFRGRDALLSGPAGGAVAVADAARAAGLAAVLGFDMGGTSTDVLRWSADEGLARVTGRRIAGVRVHSGALDIVTVAAGGGSILGGSARRLAAGPESAGASPGPACYRQGGPATVTDANVVLGRVQAAFFPACFGPAGDLPLDAAASRERLAPLAAGAGLTLEEAAAGYVRVANETMARAIREVSALRGHDPRDHALVAFGGAAPQHACALADVLGIDTVLLPPGGGVLSAHGMGLADATREESEALLVPVDETGLARAADRLAALAEPLLLALRGEGVPEAHVVLERSLDLRVKGSEHAIEVRLDAAGVPPLAALVETFWEGHARLFGFRRDGASLELAVVRVRARGALERVPDAPLTEQGGEPEPVATVAAWFETADGDGRRLVRRGTPVFRRLLLGAGARLVGPALVAEDVSTIVIDPGWEGRVDEGGRLLLTRTEPIPRETISTAQDPVRLEVFACRFMSIAEQMGETLRRLSHSTNMKERLDYSCAVFTADGRLVANAPHVPVHLGAMGATVRALLAERGEAGFEPGLALASNDPFRGGSHLPDVTVVTPVFSGAGRLFAFVACRGHHSDVGGVRPGSMPPLSRTLAEEGVVLHDLPLARNGRFLREDVAPALRAPPWPVRDVESVLANLESQVAANAMGARLLADLAQRLGDEVVTAWFGHVLADAEEATRDFLLSLPRGTHRREEVLDDGTRLAVAITVGEGEATFDFTGTAGQHAANLNAPRAVTTAVVLYVLRCLALRPIPLNEGCLVPVRIVVPEGSVLDPRAPAAVAGGNVETSMRLADLLFGALGVLAGSQGTTMNNVTFGNASFGAYETLGGGAAAGPDFRGASAVHSHLTNTRLTDVEVLERRCPVVVRELAIRRGSGGPGAFPGGDGMVRALEFLAPLEVAVLSERRAAGARGMAGGGEGRPGQNRLVRRDGTELDLGGRGEASARPGDILVVETPGGGGFGAPPGATG